MDNPMGNSSVSTFRFAWLPVAAAKEAAEVWGAQMFPPESRRLQLQVGLEPYRLQFSSSNPWDIFGMCI